MADSSPDPPRNNWFLRIFFGNAPPLAPELRRVLRLVALGMVFENYDIGLVNSALPQIADDLAISTQDTGFFLGAIRLGGFLTILMVPFADRLGRRRVFLASLIGMSLGTFATAFVQTPEQFVAVQLITRAFMLAGAALAVVIASAVNNLMKGIYAVIFGSRRTGRLSFSILTMFGAVSVVLFLLF